MVASEFLDYVRTFSATTFVGVEDFADKANFQWNVIILLLSMILVTMRQYFMSPLVCYMPNIPSGENAAVYVTNMCWAEGTIVTKDNKISYYQWVPLVLGLQAIIFRVPRIIWSTYVYNRTGTNLEELIRMASQAHRESEEVRHRQVLHITRNLEMLLFTRRGLKDFDPKRRFINKLPAKRRGNNLIFYYLIIKLFYTGVGVGQILFMYHFLGFHHHRNYFFFGLDVLFDLVMGRGWQITGVFPRLTSCQQTLQNVGGNVIVYAECVLPINMLNEKIYVFLYIFQLTVLIMTTASIPLWIFRMGPKKRQRHFVKRFLKISDFYRKDDPDQIVVIDKFLSNFLRSDGSFILRMLSMNAGDLITVEIVCCLFGRFKEHSNDYDFRGTLIRSRKEKGHEVNDLTIALV